MVVPCGCAGGKWQLQSFLSQLYCEDWKMFRCFWSLSWHTVFTSWSLLSLVVYPEKPPLAACGESSSACEGMSMQKRCDCGSGSFGASGWLPRFQRWPLETKREYRSMIFLVWILLHYYLKKNNNAEAGCGQKWPWSLRKAEGLYLSQYHWISVGVGKVWMDSSP